MSIAEHMIARSLEEAAELAAGASHPARYLAGGTDLLPAVRPLKEPPHCLVSLKGIEALYGVSQTGLGEIVIGALETHAALAAHPLIRDRLPALSQACARVGSPAIRNLGTLGGNLCNASPAGDTAPPLLAYEAHALLWSPQGERRIPLEAFFKGPSETDLRPGEILTGIAIPPPPPWRGGFEKLGKRRALEIAIVNAALAAAADENGRLARIRMALGAAAPTPIRLRRAESLLAGRALCRDLIRKASQAAMEEAQPITDMRASAAYRRQMAAALVERLLGALQSELTGHGGKGEKA